MLTQSSLRRQDGINNRQIKNKLVDSDEISEEDIKDCVVERIYHCSPDSDASESWWRETLCPASYSSFFSFTPADSCRVYRGGIARLAAENDVWDLSDSIVELYESEQRCEALRSSLNRRSAATAIPKISSSQSWMTADRANGFIRIFSPDCSGPSQLVPCSLSTTTHRLCVQLQISSSALYVQFSNGVVQRLEPQSYPLGIQNDFLANLGISDISSIQEVGASEDLQHIIKFYSGKPLCPQWYSYSQLEAVVHVKKGGLLKHWQHRLCVLSNTRLLIYKDKQRRDGPTVVELAGGMVEEEKLKGHDWCLKLTCGPDNDKLVFLSFGTQRQCGDWFTKCVKILPQGVTEPELLRLQVSSGFTGARDVGGSCSNDLNETNAAPTRSPPRSPPPLQTPLKFYRRDALTAGQPTASKH